MKAVTLGDDGVEIKELPNPEPTSDCLLYTSPSPRD